MKDSSPNRHRATKVGRPSVIDREGFNRSFGAILERLNDETISRRQAAKDLNIGYATLKRLLDSGYMVDVTEEIDKQET